jgi:8-oxo-dGTP pyrophosphatase MutT (NUDIX family)
MRQQVGALPIRWNGDELSVLLVTSRDTQRWIIPKGWRMRGRSDAEAAAQEALEEAGVRGRVRAEPIGRYHYLKRRANAVEDCLVTTYLLEVVDELVAFPEMDERRRGWFTPAEAADCADDLGLRDILRDLEARLRAERTGDTASPKPKAAKSKATKAKASKPKVSKPKVSKPKVSKPKVSKPKVSKPKTPQPDASQPKAAKPEAAEPEAAKSKGSKSKSSKSKALKSKALKSKALKSKRVTAETETLARVDRATVNGVRADAAPAEVGAANAERPAAKLAKRKSSKAKAADADAESAKAKPKKATAGAPAEPEAGAAASGIVDDRRVLN